MENPKVFVIGFFRTGTSSVGKALSILGYNILLVPWYVTHIGTGWPEFKTWHHIQVQDKVKEYDAFKDYPWMFLYRELSRWYPGAKFIYTRRDPFSAATSEFNVWQRACSGYTEDGLFSKLLSRQQRHQDEVQRFIDDGNKVLDISVVNGDGWPKLCEYLDKEIPTVPFPHLR